MIVPSIDLMDGQAVQLIGGEKKAIEAGDPMPIAQRFSLAGDIAVIDLDAALGQGENEVLIRSLVSNYSCRVGGGIRDRETATKWLDAGAKQVILGTAAKPELLSTLPRERVIAAVDARHGEVVVEGWQKGTGAPVIERIKELLQNEQLRLRMGEIGCRFIEDNFSLIKLIESHEDLYLSALKKPTF